MSKFHSILFLLESKKIIVQRHYTWQPYKKNMMQFRYSALDSVSPVPPFFLGVPLGSVIIIWFLRQSQKEESWIVVVPSCSGSFMTLVSHTVGD